MPCSRGTAVVNQGPSSCTSGGTLEVLSSSLCYLFFAMHVFDFYVFVYSFSFFLGGGGGGGNGGFRI